MKSVARVVAGAFVALILLTSCEADIRGGVAIVRQHGELRVLATLCGEPVWGISITSPPNSANSHLVARVEPESPSRVVSFALDTGNSPRDGSLHMVDGPAGMVMIAGSGARATPTFFFHRSDVDGLPEGQMLVELMPADNPSAVPARAIDDLYCTQP